MTTSRDQSLTLSAAAADIRRRLADIFLLDSRNERPLHGGQSVCLSLLHCTALHNVPSWLCYCWMAFNIISSTLIFPRFPDLIQVSRSLVSRSFSAWTFEASSRWMPWLLPVMLSVLCHQGRFYIEAGRRGHLSTPPPPIQKLVDRSDVISEVPKCSKIQIFGGSALDPAGGAYGAPPELLADGEGAHCPLPRTPPPLSALQVSFLRLSGSNPLQSWQPY